MRASVKSRAFSGLLALASIGSLASLARGQPAREAPLLFGGGSIPKKPPVQTDPWLPTGAETANPSERPPDREAAGCSARAPVCVHRGAGVGEPQAARALEALESAYARLVWALRLPAPAPDERRGGSDALDLYLVKDPAELSVAIEPDPTQLFDRAAAFCVLGQPERQNLERAATLCVGEAIAAALDPAETPFLRRAYASHLWLIAGNRAAIDWDAFDLLQANPELSIAARESTRTAEAAAMFFEYLDLARGTGQPGKLATSLFSAGVGKTRPNAWLWDNAPDAFDVLRRTLDDKPREIAKLFGDFAVARAFVGDRSDGLHLPALDWLGSFGRPRVDWSIKLSSLPRRVAATRPIEPSGAIYVWLELDEAILQGIELGFQAVWEAPVSFQWTIVKIGPEGDELARFPAPFVERGTEVEQRLVNLDGAIGLLVVGTNLGGTDLAHPFDPDLSPFEPHGCTMYFAKL